MNLLGLRRSCDSKRVPPQRLAARWTVRLKFYLIVDAWEYEWSAGSWDTW